MLSRASNNLSDGIHQVSAAGWDACAGDASPFVSHAFLAALEDSRSAVAETGWTPRHLAIEDARGVTIAVVPMYLKAHSFGEYVFDQSWADALARAGGCYYPKLQISVPFTPVAGPRLLVRPGGGEAARAALIDTLTTVAHQSGASSLHVTFCGEAESRRLGEAGFLRRAGIQFVWQNRGYARIDDFLAALTARKRKAIARERRAVRAAGINFRCIPGADLSVRQWDEFFRFYRNTADRKWGYPYLTREFFAQIGGTMADKIVLMVAERDGAPIAAALNLIGNDALFGRYWGCLEHHPFLHFELCYYQAIEYAIAHGLGRVEAGAQGPHKLARGYLPVRTHSAHWIRHDGLRHAVSAFLTEERRAIDAEIVALTNMGPYRNQSD